MYFSGLLLEFCIDFELIVEFYILVCSVLQLFVELVLFRVLELPLQGSVVGSANLYILWFIGFVYRVRELAYFLWFCVLIVVCSHVIL